MTAQPTTPPHISTLSCLWIEKWRILFCRTNIFFSLVKVIQRVRWLFYTVLKDAAASSPIPPSCSDRWWLSSCQNTWRFHTNGVYSLHRTVHAGSDQNRERRRNKRTSTSEFESLVWERETLHRSSTASFIKWYLQNTSPDMNSEEATLGCQPFRQSCKEEHRADQ